MTRVVMNTAEQVARQDIESLGHIPRHHIAEALEGFSCCQGAPWNTRRGKGLFPLILLHHCSSLRDVMISNRVGTWRQELMLRLWRAAPQRAFSQNPGPPPAQGWPHHNGLDPSPSITNFKMPHRVACSESLWSCFSQLSFSPLR